MGKKLPLVLGFTIVALLAVWAFRRQSASSPVGSEAPSATVTSQPATPPAAPAASPEASVKRIDPTRVWEMVQKNEVTVIDVRDADSYLARHVPGALHIPLARIEGEAQSLARDKPVVTYCT